MQPFDHLCDYPQVKLFLNNKTQKPVHACLWGQGAKIFFQGTTSRDTETIIGDRSAQIDKDTFNRKYHLFNDTVDTVDNIHCARLDSKKKSSHDFQQIDRSNKNNFISYMLVNPVYFSDTFDMACTKDNIEQAFNEVSNYRGDC
jgi:hypothetical protein